ncbi:PIN domain-like protein [Imleria badia]|nr:PIN domain-like protein [Imleria badia]
MGVHGLTTYLRENQRVLGKTKQFSPARVSDETVTTIVIDGLSFIFEIYQQSRLPWVYGGEYEAFARCVVQVVKAWIAVGLKVYFVFDGASPSLKIPTLISRLNRNNVQNSVLFFRTSPTSRSTPRFLHENRIIPPLVFLSCIETLESLAKENPELFVHFADEEGDPYAVELAGRLGAYVVGNDSDFVILNSGRYAGYIPLEGMLWTAPLPVNEFPSTYEEQEDGFQTVVSKTKKRSNPASQQTAFGLIPPEETPLSDLVLSVIVYTPSTLAFHLKLPTTLLPLLASLIGNDFSNTSTTQRNVQSLFFERSLTLSQRITRTANTLSSILDAATQKRKAKHRVGSVMDLIDRTVNALLVRSPSSLAAGEIDSIVDRIVNAALQYAIDKYEGDVYGPASLWPTLVCALHGGDTCPLPNLFSRALLQSQVPGNVNGAPEDSVLMVRSLYVKVFRAGKLQPQVTNSLSTGTFWPRIFLDNPDFESVAVSIGRPIRTWVYALLDDGVGLPEAPEEDLPAVEGSVSEGDEAEVDPDELIDVVEENSDDDADFLAPLRGELQRLRGPEEDPSDTVPASASSRSRSRPPARPKYVSEYVRRGIRIASEEVPVPDLAALMISSGFAESIDTDAWVPVQLRSLEERMALFLHILGSNVPAVKNVSPDRLMAVLVVRWIVQTLHQRALESSMSKGREQERWTRQEARALLTFYGSPPSMNVGDTASHANGSDTNPPTTIPLIDRNVQLMAQVLMAVESIHLLSQLLFLTEQVPANIQALSGQKLHAYLTNSTPVPEEVLAPGLWDACTTSLEDAFALERPKKARKTKVEQIKPVAKANNRTTTSRPVQGLFSLLVDDLA